jgi:hypothetical protein
VTSHFGRHHQREQCRRKPRAKVGSQTLYGAVSRKFDDYGIFDPQWTDLCLASHDQSAAVTDSVAPRQAVDRAVYGLQKNSPDPHVHE